MYGMKISVRVLLFSLLISGALSCAKDNIPSATDPLPFPLDQYKDLSTAPGDDFWQYCNGSWYAQTPTPATEATGGIYDAFPVMDDKVGTIIAEDPSLNTFFRLRDELYANSDAAVEYFNKLKDKYPAPASRDDAFRAIGRLIMDGMPFFGFDLNNDWKDGELIAMLGPNGSVYKYSFADLDPASQEAVRLIAGEMGVAPESIYFPEDIALVLGMVSKLPLEDLIKGIDSCLAQWYPYINEELNAASEAWTPEYTSTKARTYAAYELSYRLAQKYVTPELKQYYQDLVGRVIDAFRERLRNLDWMSEVTKNNAIDKLDKMIVCIGCPDTWYEDCIPDLRDCKSLLEAVHKLSVANVRLHKHLIGTRDVFTNSIVQSAKDVTGNLKSTDLTLVNSYYRREYNCFVILPSMILPPVTKPGLSEACAYGAIVVAAHEITHGFDDAGAQYDAVGRIHNWWTVADKIAFEDRQKKLIQCYNMLEFDPYAYPGKFTDGTRTLGENLADLGGFMMTRDAYAKRLKEQGFTGENYTAQLKKFYESYADLWRNKYSQEKLNVIINQDIHSHCRSRVNGVVMNTDEWYDLYDVTRNNILYLPPERRTYIW